MTHNKKKNKRFVKDYYNDPDGDDYVYPTKKGRENKTRNRRSDQNIIQAGLNEYENPENTHESLYHDPLDQRNH